jgi:microcompartment protein CcmL/EutN
MGAAGLDKLKDIGVIETMSALSSIQAADIAVKASNIRLIEVRIARGLGGKGFVLLTGEISAVKNAIKACENELSSTGELLCASVIASPNDRLIPHLM